jgi:hypothetical protein
MTVEPEVIFKDKLDAAIPRAAPHEAFHEPDPIIGLVTESTELVVGLIEEVRRSFELQVSRLETEIAKLAGENATLKVLAEQGRAPGARGPRGVAGLKGERGERGEPGAKILSWSVRESDFSAAPIMSDGSIGAELKLEPLLASLARALAGKEAGR